LEHLKKEWIEKYTLYGTDAKYRRQFYKVKQQRKTSRSTLQSSSTACLHTEPGEEEVYYAFVSGLDKNYRDHLYQKEVKTLVDAVSFVREFYLAHSQMKRDAPVPEPMDFVRTEGEHHAQRELTAPVDTQIVAVTAYIIVRKVHQFN